MLEDFVTVLHRDGTATHRRRWVVILHSVKEIEGWERITYYFDRRTSKCTIPRALMTLPSGKERLGRITDTPRDHRGYSHGLEVRFAHLAPGAVVELEDQLDHFTPYGDCPGVWGDLALRTPHPCQARRIVLAVARPFTARYGVHNGAPDPVESQVGDYHVWTWELRDIPGIEWDQMTPPIYEFAPWVDFSTLPNWKPVASYYLKQLKLPAGHDLKNVLTKLPVVGEGAENKLAAAYNYVARDVRYGRPNENSHDFAVRPLSAVAEELRGDCKDKSALLVALLRTFCIEAHVALIRTAQVGRAQLLPGGHFNHALVFARVNGKEIWLDPAGGAYSLGQLPYYDQGTRALLLDRTEPQEKLIPPAAPADHRLERIVRGHLDADGSYHAQVRLVARGDRSSAWRWGLLERNASMRERTLRQYVGASLPTAEITQFSYSPVDDLNGDLTISHSFIIRKLARRIQNLILLRIPWLEILRDTGFFAASSRPQPLSVPVHSISDRHRVELPSGFSGYGLPFERSESCEWGGYQCRIRIEDGALHCERDFELRGGLIPPERVNEMRTFMDLCIDGDASDIVLRGENFDANE